MRCAAQVGREEVGGLVCEIAGMVYFSLDSVYSPLYNRIKSDDREKDEEP